LTDAKLKSINRKGHKGTEQRSQRVDRQIINSANFAFSLCSLRLTWFRFSKAVDMSKFIKKSEKAIIKGLFMDSFYKIAGYFKIISQ